VPDVDEAVDAVEAAAEGRPMGWLARAGLTARGAVYLVMGVLAILVGVGARKHVDQRGALTEVLAAPVGSALVLLLAIGFAAYAVWRFSEVAVGVTGEADGVGPRLKSLARGLAYSVLTATALGVLTGARGSQSGQQEGIAADVMSRSGGRWAVGLVGVVVVAVGLVMVREGWSKKFTRYFGSLDPHVRRWIVPLGRVGTVSRGVVFAIAGALVVAAAWTADPEKAGGVDDAFRTLLQQPYGAALVVLLGAGLVVFGVYGLAEAVYRRVPGDRS
jgi:hypothetical protein